MTESIRASSKKETESTISSDQKNKKRCIPKGVHLFSRERKPSQSHFVRQLPHRGEPVIPSLSLWERWRVYEPERAETFTVPVGGGATTPRKSLSVQKSLSVSHSSTAPPVGEPVIPSLSLWEKFLLRSNGGGAGWHPVAYGGAVFVHTFLTPLRQVSTCRHMAARCWYVHF